MLRNFRSRHILLLIILLLLTFSTYLKIAQADSTSNTQASLTVPPRVTDFQFSFTSDDTNPNFNQNTIRSYTIDYGALSSANLPTNTSITVDYSKDSINGTQVMEYVIGSATKGYGSSIPVIDTVKHTITWTMPNLPAGTTDQKLAFKLVSTGNYIDANSISITTKANMKNQFVALSEKTVSENYIYRAQPINIPTPTTTTVTPALTPSLSLNPILSPPTPTSAPPLKITDVFFNNIADKKAQISITTSLPAKISVQFGTSTNSLTQSASSESFAVENNLQLSSLIPGGVYFIRIQALDKSGNKNTSEIFTFKTAKLPQSVEIDKSSSILMSSGNILTSTNAQQNQNTNSQTVLPNTANFEVSYSLPQSTKVDSIDVLLRDKHILGISTFEFIPKENILSIAMVEKQPGVYYAMLPPVTAAGDYEVYVSIKETNGNIFEQKLSDITISLPLKVVEEGTAKQISDARVFYYFYDTKTRQYEVINQSFGNIANPDFSDTSGFLHTTLPQGKYKVEIDALFYAKTTKTFTLDSKHPYPTIYLKKSPFDVISIAQYLLDTVFDFVSGLNNYVLGLTAARYFNMVAINIVAISVFLAFLFFSLKTRIPLLKLPITLYHYVHHTIPFQNAIIIGKVVSQNKYPLSRVNIFLLDDNEKVLSSVTTNNQGVFTYKRIKEASHMHIVSEGFEELNTPITHEANPYYVLITNPDTFIQVKQTTFQSLFSILGIFFEMLLALSFLCETAFVVHFGFLKTLPFLTLSFANILLWIFYTKESVKNFLRK